MKKLPLTRTAIGVVVLAALALPGVAWGSGGPAYQAGATTTPPTIDGTITAAEWADATAYSISFGGIAATVRFEHTATDLYVGVVVNDFGLAPSPSLSVYFDNNHDGVKQLGEDAWLDFPPLAQDFFWNGTSHINDVGNGGANETVASSAGGSGAITFEIRHPLSSGDTAHDIAAAVGQTLGVDFQYQQGLGFYDAPGLDTTNPSITWGDLLLAAGDTTAPTVTVTQPAAGTVLSGTSVPVAATASDNVGVASVHFQYYDPPTYTDLGTDTTEPFTATFDSTTVRNVVSGAATMYATARDAAGNTTTVGNAVGVSNITASLTGSVSASTEPTTASTRSVNLTSAGNLDWAIWGYAGQGTSTSLAPDVRKNGGSGISDLTNIDPAPSAPLRGMGQFPAQPYLFDWFDGGGQPQGSAARAGIQHNGEPPTSVSTLGKGFSFDVPAGTAPRTLTVYVATNRASGQLTASLSDGSAPNYVDTLPPAGDVRSGIYTIRYAAASRGQTLHVQWVETQDNCAQFRCDNAAVYAVALSSNATDAHLSAGTSVGMSGSNDAIVDLPLRAFEPVPSGTTPAPINGLPLNGLPINGLPINGLPINGLPINGLPLNGLPINGLPLNGLPINGLPINGLPINALPLTTPGGWAAALAGTALEGLPLQTITLQQVLGLSPRPDAVTHLSLGQLDLSNSTLGRMTIGALALGATPINALGLPSDALASLQTWCQSVVTPASNCTSAAIGNQSLFSLALAGAPLNGLPLNGLPLNGLPLNGLPINGLPINGLDVSASPLNGLPLNGLPLNGLTLALTPINGLSLTSILGAHGPGGTPSAFRAIKIADLATRTNVITSCTVVGLDCVTGTLGDAAGVNAIKSSALLADIGTAALGSLTLGDLHFYGALTIGDLEQSLVGTQATLGDLIGLLVKRADVPWETLSPRLLSVFDTDRPRLALTASFTAGGSGVGTVSAQVTLPPGFDVVPGSAKLSAPGTEFPTTLADPTVDGDLATWSIPSLSLGVGYTLRFSAFSGTDVGPAQASVRVSSGGTTSVSTASFAVTDSFEPNNDASAGGLPVIAPDTAVQQSVVASRGDVDYYKVALPPAGTRLLIHLTNLPADYDLALYASQTTSVRTTTATGAALQDGTVPDQSINTQGGSNPQLTPTALQDVPDPGIPAVQVSANRGTDDEDAGFVSPGGTGYALIAVYGYNGASNAKPYSLRVTTQAPLNLMCTARSFPSSTGTAGSLPATASMPTDLNTLILVNGKRIGDTYGGTAQTDVVSALNHLAGDRTLGVSGAVIPVEALAPSQYTAWDQNPCNSNAANAVANAIADKIAEVKAARPGLKYVVFAGGDDQIPFFRSPDLSRIANESGFASSFARNEYYGALAAGNLLTDDPYLDTRPIPASGRQLFVPDLIGGRLVEKPSQIIGAVSRFETSGGTLARSTAFVSGYDFVTDGSAQVQSRLNTFLGASPARTLINDTWSKAQLLAAAFPTGGSAAINDWNGHYDNHQALAANGDQTNLITTTDLTGPYALSGGIFFTMGCHAGFQTSDAIVGSASPDKLDWSEYFAGSGTSFVGNTGFGLGNTDSVAFSEELMAGFAGNLNGSVSIGAALANAKQSYYLARTAFSSYDEKTLSEAELYGLPMYGVGVAPAAVGAPTAPAPTASPDPTRGAASSTSPSQGTLTALPSTSAQVASFSVVPTFTAQSGSRGQYLTNSGQVQAPNYRPLQPFVSLPATRSGTFAHGVLVDGLTSSDLTPFNPDNVRPTLDLSATEPEPQFADQAWPTKVPTLVSLNDTNGLRQNLNLTTGQFFTDDTTHAGVERKWTRISGRVTYSSSTDFTPPTVDSIDAFLSGGAVTFSGRFRDLNQAGVPATVALVQVVYDVDNSGTWLALPLQFNSTTGAWSGGAAFSGTAVQYFVEVCDLAGNCGYSSNKGRYFDAQPLPAPGGPITLTPSRAPDAGAWYTGPLSVTPAASGGTDSVSVSVDGGAFAPATGAISLSGDGSHVVVALGSDGSKATAVFFIDTLPPTVTVTCPTDPFINASATAFWTATDNVSGILGAASGTISLDTSAFGPHTVTVTAVDNAGHTGTGTCSYTVVIWPFTGFFSPVDNLPTLNVIKPGQAVPVKFSLGGDRGLSIFVTGYPRMETISCSTSAATDLIELTVTAGGSSLSYDASSQRYSYVWKTPSSGWASGTCRQLVLKFVDGTTQRASFKAK